jgi:UDP-N-acetyl-D-glucosamine 2-epimerase, UDP-hydrolysing
MKKKIFIITSSRADYSPLKNLIHAFEESKLFKTFIIATGQHLDKKSGNTINEIKKNHKAKIRKVKIQYKKFSENDISFYISQMIKKFSLLLKKNRPHLIMILGDRYEVLSFALAAVQFRIPIAHIHGGEVTKGSLDNTYRNILTKISNIHFVCHNDYKRRVIQMGEDPKLVFNFGSPSLETKKNQIKKNIDRKLFKFIKNKNTYIITYHPNTIFPKATTKELDNLLQAIENFDNLNFIFSYPNFDNFNSEIVKKINSFSKNRKNVRIIKSIGREKYFIFLRMVAGLIGNSSSSI